MGRARGLLILTAVASLLLPTVSATAETFHAQLSGYEETPLTLDTAASGEFRFRIHAHDTGGGRGGS